MSQPGNLDPIRRALAATFQSLRDDREHGASWLARLVARSLHDAASAVPDASSETHAHLLHMLHDAAHDFATARPSMAAVANAAARIWFAAATVSDPRAALASLRNKASRILDGEQTWATAIRENLRPLLTGSIITLSRSDTVERALIDLVSNLPDEARQIYVAESRPGGEGIAAARALAEAGWRVTLCADTALGVFVPHAAVAFVGADSIRSDGSVVNKVGTYLLALAAREAGVPCYAACETLKIAAPNFPLVLEEMDPAEILPEALPGVTVSNPYFEETPAHFITGIVTERGALSPDEIAREATSAAEALAALVRPYPQA